MNLKLGLGFRFWLRLDLSHVPVLPVSSEISDLRNFWLHTMYACTDWYSSWQIRW